MERLTEWYDDGKSKGIMVKESYGEKVLKTLFSEWDEGYLAMCKLKQYEDMEEQGEMIILPCKPGDTVYTIGLDKPIEMTLSIVSISKNGVLFFWYPKEVSEKIPWSASFQEKDIGKTVFLTEQEAKEALEETKE